MVIAFECVINRSANRLSGSRNEDIFELPISPNQIKAKTKELIYNLKGLLEFWKLYYWLYKALLLAGQVRSIFQQLRKGRKVLCKLSDDQIQELIHQLIKGIVGILETLLLVI